MIKFRIALVVDVLGIHRLLVISDCKKWPPTYNLPIVSTISSFDTFVKWIGDEQEIEEE